MFHLITILSSIILARFIMLSVKYIKTSTKPKQILVKPKHFHVYYRGRRGLGLETVAGMTKVLFQDDSVVWVPSEMIEVMK